jgi:carboxypeptidase Q
VTVTLCADSLGGLLDGDYKYRGEILMQDMFSMGAFEIEHPDQANDEAAQQLAGLEGALKAYRSILRDKPEAKSPVLERFVQAQSRGELPDYFRKVAIRCFSKK